MSPNRTFCCLPWCCFDLWDPAGHGRAQILHRASLVVGIPLKLPASHSWAPKPPIPTRASLVTHPTAAVSQGILTVVCGQATREQPAWLCRDGDGSAPTGSADASAWSHRRCTSRSLSPSAAAGGAADPPAGMRGNRRAEHPGPSPAPAPDPPARPTGTHGGTSGRLWGGTVAGPELPVQGQDHTGSSWAVGNEHFDGFPLKEYQTWASELHLLRHRPACDWVQAGGCR